MCHWLGTALGRGLNDPSEVGIRPILKLASSSFEKFGEVHRETAGQLVLAWETELGLLRVVGVGGVAVGGDIVARVLAGSRCISE